MGRGPSGLHFTPRPLNDGRHRKQVLIRLIEASRVHRPDQEQVGRIRDRFAQVGGGQAHDLPMPELKGDLGEEAQQLGRANPRQAGQEHPVSILRLPGFLDEREDFVGVEARLSLGEQRNLAARPHPPRMADHHLAPERIAAGQPLRETLNQRNLSALRRASENRQWLGLERYIEVDDRDRVGPDSGLGRRLNQPADHLSFTVELCTRVVSKQ